MEEPTGVSHALDRAARALGSMAAVARAAGARSDSAVHMWRQRGNVPAEYCPGIERATREKAAEAEDPTLIVTCEELRPDVAWAVLRVPLASATDEAANAGSASCARCRTSA